MAGGGRGGVFGWFGVSGDPNFFLQISFSWVEISLHVEFHPPGLPRSGRFIQSLTLFKAGGGGGRGPQFFFFFFF